MPREINIWYVFRMIKILRLGGFSTSEIEGVLRPDLHLKVKLDGSIIETPSDKKIIAMAYEEPLESLLHTRYERDPSFFGFNNTHNEEVTKK